MPVNYIPRRFTVIRDKDLCINCGCCVRQCSNECHLFADDGKTVIFSGFLPNIVLISIGSRSGSIEGFVTCEALRSILSQ